MFGFHGGGGHGGGGHHGGGHRGGRGGLGWGLPVYSNYDYEDDYEVVETVDSDNDPNISGEVVVRRVHRARPPWGLVG